jgi:hypothetical protein
MTKEKYETTLVAGARTVVGLTMTEKRDATTRELCNSIIYSEGVAMSGEKAFTETHSTMK